MPLTIAIGELDADLTAIAALSPSNDDVIQRKTGAWTNRTMAQLAADLVATGSLIRKATVTLSSADILALHTTPITLVAAPGAGKWLLVHRTVGVLTYGTTAYSVADGISPFYDGGGQPLGDLTAMFQASASTVGVSPGASAYSAPLSSAENKAVVLTDGAGDPTLGDSTATITVWYSVEDVPA